MRSRLLTLAACESAASKIEAGDEPLGLIPALLFAGVGAVVATLWPVHSPATAELMDAFYQVLLQPQYTGDRATALRQAINTLRQHPDYTAPYYWSAYIIYGDWRSFLGGSHGTKHTLDA
jgi:CHAT domain-containing protein